MKAKDYESIRTKATPDPRCITSRASDTVASEAALIGDEPALALVLFRGFGYHFAERDFASVLRIGPLRCALC
jgi:hypothetical protein